MKSRSWFLAKINQVDKSLARLTKEKRKKTNLLLLGIRRTITSDLMDIKKENKEILWTTPCLQFDNLAEMGQYSWKTQSTKSQKRNSNLNRPLSIKLFESIINNLPNQNGPDLVDFLGDFYQTFRKEILPILCNLFQKNRKQREYFLTYFMRPAIILTPKLRQAWNLGPFAAVLKSFVPGHISSQATVYKETIWDYKLLCACAVKANSRPKIPQNTQAKTKPFCCFWRTWSQNGVSGAKAGCSAWGCPALSNTRMGKPPQPPFQPDPCTHSLSCRPCKKQAQPPALGTKQGSLSLVSAPSWSPNEGLIEFLVWLPVNFYWLGNLRKPSGYQN